MSHGAGAPLVGMRMSPLANLQRTFQGYVLRGEPDVLDRITGGERVDPRQRLRIYFDAYRLRLVEALATDYEALRALMGDERFKTVCNAYVEATASVLRNVRWYGAGLPEFLRTTSPWSQQIILHELALFEWTLTLAFDAADHSAVRFEDLASVPQETWPALGFVLHPSVHLLELRTNAPALRKATDTGEALPEAVLASDSKTWLVWRKELTACFRSLSEPESWALTAVRGAADFTALCEGLCRWFSAEEAAPHAAALLRQWVDDELICGLTA
ncbi:MAG TPA: DNA-binding domain-containing protein [Burkholderiales bacterium]|nr:DNA-binding domain-containing protein [Burkholderiales bacterium]